MYNKNGTRPEQRIITGTLANLSELAVEHSVQSPALLIIGEVAAFAHSLHWFGDAPLIQALPTRQAA
ncbi:MAG: hypothetical protein KA902_06140 [Arenimonas sp.]|nr:hypothetical protein [Arenimonas sp.]